MQNNRYISNLENKFPDYVFSDSLKDIKMYLLIKQTKTLKKICLKYILKQLSLSICVSNMNECEEMFVCV